MVVSADTQMNSTSIQHLQAPLRVVDSEIYDLVKKEDNRQRTCLELIASENFTSAAVMEANGTCLTNKYAEGLPGARYYGGNEYIDEVEKLCQKRALELFNLDPSSWGVNVQPYSGSTANFAAFTGLIQPHDRIMGLDLPSGGHLTHGYQTAKKKVSASAIYFDSLAYHVDNTTGIVEYDKLADTAKDFRPKLLICGASAYPQEWDYARMRSIADSTGSYLLCDMAHISGLVAGQVVDSPFQYCDVVTTTTHKTLRGPRAGLIFFRKDRYPQLEKSINDAVFPGCQGGPHCATIAGVAVALKMAATPEFKEYAANVIKNAKRLAAKLQTYGYKIATGGTENHIVLWDLRPEGISGSKLEKVCDLANITINKNAVHGDTSALVPGGVRLGTSALTTRCFGEQDFERVAEMLHTAVEISKDIQVNTGKQMKDFLPGALAHPEIKNLRNQVESFAQSFPMPGVPFE